MDFTHSAKVLELKAQLEAFMDEHVYPNEGEYDAFTRDHNNLWTQPPLTEDLKAKAREAGIWNWFLPREYEPWSPGLSNVEFAPLAEVMGRAPWSFEVFNCSAPDRGNMEDLAQKGLNAIRGNHLYVVSHPETQPAVEARFQRILDAYDLIPS